MKVLCAWTVELDGEAEQPAAHYELAQQAYPGIQCFQC